MQGKGRSGGCLLVNEGSIQGLLGGVPIRGNLRQEYAYSIDRNAMMQFSMGISFKNPPSKMDSNTF